MQLLLAAHPPNALPALAYARTMLQPLYSRYTSDINRLLACAAFLPITRLQRSPYADLASPSLHYDLEPLFAKEYCTSLGMSRQVPLRVVGDIGGGGALARIEKGRKVMRERKSEWSQTDELPVRIQNCLTLTVASHHGSHHRLKSPCLLRTGTTQYLLALSPRNSRPPRIPR